VAGILNMALFPKMGATFITYVSGLGQTEQVAKAEQTAKPATRAAIRMAAQPPAAGEDADAPMLSNEQLVNLITSILIVLVLVYTVMGGMVSVIVTDYLQFVILSLGLGLGLYFCLTHPDLGWDNMVAALKTHRGERAFNPVHKDSYGWLWAIWTSIHFAVAALCWAPEVTRALTARDPTTTKRTFLFGSPGQFVRLAIPVLFAIAAFCYISRDAGLTAHFFPDGLGGDPLREHSGQAMPLLLGKIIPTGLLGLIVAGMMAAFMSTHDSYFLCWSSVITRDVIGPMRKKELSDRSQIWITRILIIFIGIFLLIWGVWYDIPASVWTYMAVTGSVYMCGSIVALVGGMYWKRASSIGAMAALLGGLISAVAIFLPDKYRSDSMLMGILGVANYGFCAVVFVVFSLLFPD
jgi:SSS family solute:Na+ symporter